MGKYNLYVCRDTGIQLCVVCSSKGIIPNTLKDRAFNSKLFPLQLGTAIYKHTISTFQYGMLFLTVHVLRKKGIHIPDPQRF